MPAPTQAEAAAHANRVDNFGRALKTAGHGGPFRREWAREGYTAAVQGQIRTFDGAGNEVQPAIAAVNRAPGNWENEADFRAEHPRYPDYVYPDDKERDTHYMIKRQMKAAGEPFGQLTSGEADISYLVDKKNAQELALFKAFVEDSIPRGTPWAREFFEKIMPGWYQSKIDIIQEKLAIVNRFIDMSIRGPQNIDDMFLLYQLYTGKITIPENWPTLIRGEEVPLTQFATGLFNPKRWIDTTYRTSKRNQEFMANFAIPGIDAKGVAGALVSQNIAAGVLGAQEMGLAGAMKLKQVRPNANTEGFFDHKIFGDGAEGLVGPLTAQPEGDAASGFARWTGRRTGLGTNF